MLETNRQDLRQTVRCKLRSSQRLEQSACGAEEKLRPLPSKLRFPPCQVRLARLKVGLVMRAVRLPEE